MYILNVGNLHEKRERRATRRSFIHTKAHGINMERTQSQVISNTISFSGGVHWRTVVQRWCVP